MSKERIIARLAPLLAKKPTLDDEDAERVIGEILERLTVEDHLELLEEMLGQSRTTDGLLRAAHQNVTAALDHVKRYAATF